MLTDPATVAGQAALDSTLVASAYPRTISPALCLRCGACCSAVVNGELVACRHLETAAGGYRCRIYATRPAVCRNFDCLRTGRPSPAIADRVAAALRQEP